MWSLKNVIETHFECRFIIANAYIRKAHVRPLLWINVRLCIVRGFSLASYEKSDAPDMTCSNLCDDARVQG